jgi:8-oxo-dGTP pyrophosphatase MutT (NUDIX family)
VKLPLPVCRAAYRGAYAALRAYWYVRRPDVQGVKCVLTDGEQILLVRHTYGHREWDLPGGKVGRREPPAAAARREMHEELGLELELAAIGQVRAWIDHRRDLMHCFTAEVTGQPLSIDRCELDVVQWFPRHALPDELGRFVTRILALDGGVPSAGPDTA